MSDLDESAFQKIRHSTKENTLVQNTIEILDEEKESLLSEVLRCYVCLELPVGKQVRICEKGHHFCLNCHSQMTFCGICRGKLMETRNFAVEQLVAKLSCILGITGSELPPAEPPINLSPGSFRCLHQCPCKMSAYHMLPHIRAKHSNHLIDNVRSSPYSGKFSFTYSLHLKEGTKHVFSAHVTDMGLFTIESMFSNLDYFGCIRGLGDKRVTSLFRYQIVVKIPNKHSESLLEYGVTNCPVLSYLDDAESVKESSLKIRGEDFLQHLKVGDVISIFFSIWKKTEKLEIKTKPLPSVTCLPERCLFFPSVRKTQRNKNRNMRKKRLKEKLRNLAVQGENSRTLSEELSTLCL